MIERKERRKRVLGKRGGRESATDEKEENIGERERKRKK